jgi:hypothetical protein
MLRTRMYLQFVWDVLLLQECSQAWRRLVAAGVLIAHNRASSQTPLTARFHRRDESVRLIDARPARRDGNEPTCRNRAAHRQPHSDFTALGYPGSDDCQQQAPGRLQTKTASMRTLDTHVSSGVSRSPDIKTPAAVIASASDTCTCGDKCR